jgi:hypothetical protein
MRCAQPGHRPLPDENMHVNEMELDMPDAANQE